MKKISMFILFLLLIIGNTIILQAQTEDRTLNIGDQCPDFIFKNIIRSSNSVAKLSDFKGKLVILDFWATWCSPCINALPEMDSLQNLFKDKLMILPITKEKKSIAEDFFKSNPIVKGNKLPSVTEDTLLYKYFPHNAIPHEIWIDGTGKVIAITKGIDVNRTTILQALEGKKIDVKNKEDLLEMDLKKPFLLGGFGPNYHFDPKLMQYSSLITDYVKGSLGYANTSINSYNDNLLRVLFINCPISLLYVDAFLLTSVPKSGNPNFLWRHPARTILDLKDSSMILYWPGISPEYTKKPPEGRAFCYEIIVPKADSSRINHYMVEDLNKFFRTRYGIEGIKEKRTVECWALTRILTREVLKSKGGQPNIIVGKNNDSMEIINMPIKEMMFLLATRYMAFTTIPIIDESNYTGNIDLNIKANLSDPISVGKALEKFGFTVKKVKRKIDMIVIRNIKN